MPTILCLRQLIFIFVSFHLFLKIHQYSSHIPPTPVALRMIEQLYFYRKLIVHLPANFGVSTNAK